jgi:hypothetical protein
MDRGAVASAKWLYPEDSLDSCVVNPTSMEIMDRSIVWQSYSNYSSAKTLINSNIDLINTLF